MPVLIAARFYTEITALIVIVAAALCDETQGAAFAVSRRI